MMSRGPEVPPGTDKVRAARKLSSRLAIPAMQPRSERRFTHVERRFAKDRGIPQAAERVGIAASRDFHESRVD